MTYKRGAVAYDQAEPAGFDTRWRLPAAPAAPESGGWDAEALERCECGGAALCAGTGRLSNPPWAFCLGELILNNRFGGSALSVCAACRPVTANPQTEKSPRPTEVSTWAWGVKWDSARRSKARARTCGTEPFELHEVSTRHRQGKRHKSSILTSTS